MKRMPAALIILMATGAILAGTALSDAPAEVPASEQSPDQVRGAPEAPAAFVLESNEQKLRGELRSRLLSLTERYAEIAPVEQLEKDIATVAEKFEEARADRALAAACQGLAEVVKDHRGTEAAEIAGRMLGQQNRWSFSEFEPARPSKKMGNALDNGIERSVPKLHGDSRF